MYLYIYLYIEIRRVRYIDACTVNTAIRAIGARMMANIALSLLRQCDCSWRSILAIATNTATVPRALLKLATLYPLTPEFLCQNNFRQALGFPGYCDARTRTVSLCFTVQCL